MNIGGLISALRTGWILKNPAAWKQRQVAINALVGLLSAAVAIARGFGYDLQISDELIAGVATGVWAVVGVFNSWATVATTDKIGLGRVEPVDRVGGSPGA